MRPANSSDHRVVVDPYQATRFGNCGLEVLEEAGVAPLVEHHAEESQIALPCFLVEGREYPLAVVQGLFWPAFMVYEVFEGPRPRRVRTGGCTGRRG